jgi:hypothetical protein
MMRELSECEVRIEERRDCELEYAGLRVGSSRFYSLCSRVGLFSSLTWYSTDDAGQGRTHDHTHTQTQTQTVTQQTHTAAVWSVGVHLCGPGFTLGFYDNQE